MYMYIAWHLLHLSLSFSFARSLSFSRSLALPRALSLPPRARGRSEYLVQMPVISKLTDSFCVSLALSASLLPKTVILRVVS